MPMYLPTSGLPPALLLRSDHCLSQTLPPAQRTLVSVPIFKSRTSLHFSHGRVGEDGRLVVRASPVRASNVDC